MKLLATGATFPAAIKKAGIPCWLFRRYCRENVELRKRWSYAKKWGRRTNYSILAVNDVLETIATTSMSVKAACAHHGVPYDGFLKLTASDPEICERYLQAQQARNFRLRTQLTEDAMSRADSITSRAEMRKERRSFQKASLVIQKLRPMRLRRAEARKFRAARGVDAPLAAARLRAKRRGRP
jgi:hypothetical protein